MNGEDRQRSKA
ncbi:hypothetical protein YPPY47_3445, partial [Yersinia pestis PY-47]